jgi:hypothetical protein
MGGDSRNPIEQDGIETEARGQAQEKRLLQVLFEQDEKKGDERNPGEKGKV